MEKTIFKAFAFYNKRANNQMNKFIETLSEEEWNKEFNSFWKSIHGLCSHIFSGDHGWLKKFIKFTNSKLINNKYFNKDYVWGETIFKNINEYIKMRQELDDIIVDFISEVKNEDLEKNMEWMDWEERIIEKQLCIYIMHMFNHATHHRAQISLCLDMLGKENDFSIFFDRDNKIE
jgi:uncharacterized damage-inducible protein DinB